jgi:pyruvate formate lyase activating enzyme
VAVTAGYMHDRGPPRFYADMDAANVDLKAFTEDFYYHLTGGDLEPVLDTLRVPRARDAGVDGDHHPAHPRPQRLRRTSSTGLSAWVANELGPGGAAAFHGLPPRLQDARSSSRTPPATLRRARAIALEKGLSHVYTGNVHDVAGDTTHCATCGDAVIVRDAYRMLAYSLDDAGHCRRCGARLAGVFEGPAGDFGPRRVPIRP